MTTDESAGPVGTGDYVVKEGDCLESIAFQRGLVWENIWSHPENADLKEARGDPNVLLPGDRLYVPQLEPKSVEAATNERHTFSRKGVLSRIRIQVVEWIDPSGEAADAESEAAGPDQADAETEAAAPTQDTPDDESGAGDTDVTSPDEPQSPFQSQPRANVPYVLTIDGQVFSGQTDSAGWIDQTIRPDARSGKLIVEPGTDRAFETSLAIGGLDPIDSDSGVCQRLANLGFVSGNYRQLDSPEIEEAIEAFQTANGLEITGLLDDDTRAKLKSIHGS